MLYNHEEWGFPGGSDSKESACNAGDQDFIPGLGRSLDWENPLKKEMATHSSILAWIIPLTEEPCGRQSMELSLTELDTTEQVTVSLSMQVIYPADVNWN